MTQNAIAMAAGDFSARADEEAGGEIGQLGKALNFLSAESLSWRDLKGDVVEPRLVNSIPVEIKTDKTVRKVWVASPDKHAGAPVELAFKQTSEAISFTVPSLKYWTMIVMD